ncbi:MAG: GFA family protein [Afipia sp.]|nr:GFA family protein [Afipia sp.]
MTKPELPLMGGCQCARVRYRILAMPVVFYLCHCKECQRHTSSAFGESLRVRSADLEIDGDLKTVRRIAESGASREGRFCPECGVRIVHGSVGSELVNVKAGTLDDTSWLFPAGHIWVRSKQPFFKIDAGELYYPGQPADNYAALAERWHQMFVEP